VLPELASRTARFRLEIDAVTAICGLRLT